MVDVVHSKVEEISKGSSNIVPEPSSSEKSPRLGGHVGGEAEGTDLEPLQIKENTLSGSLRAVVLHKRAFSKSRADLARCEVELKKISEEMDSLKTLYVKKEEEINDLRAELAKACQQRTELIVKFQRKGELAKQLREELKMEEAETLGRRQSMDNLASEKETLREQLSSLERQLRSVKEEGLARGREIEKLKVKFAAELAKAKSDVEEIMSSYRADAEAANARAKEISTATEAKTLEEEAAALLSDEDDSASGSESGGDEDEVPEGVALEDAAPEDMTPK
ncbi:PREDICTED: uncharacterized protein C9orf117 homolog [Nicotiana attenuata]|uniref:uncharacterized protein C9orf117 homolog n=1 Tax=Nicotiana attenuata TaxID=49451 RepID=UPI0009049F34|nr:PREDICTED: uncharacterized protein C9orf117 homolog [Nicotiana attenuata]